MQKQIWTEWMKSANFELSKLIEFITDQQKNQ